MFDPHRNFVYSTVATAPSPASSGTSLVLESGAGSLFPDPGVQGYNVTVWSADENPLVSNAEIVRVTAKSGDTLTIVRAQEGSSARTVLVGDQIAVTITAKVLTDVEEAIRIPGLADSFNPNSDGNILVVAIQADDKILAGGNFAIIGGQTRNRIARLDATTGLADSFDPNSNAPVFAIVVQPDDKILAGGAFTNIGGQTRRAFARIDATTGLADSLDLDLDLDSAVQTIVVQPSDGAILLGGIFTSVLGETRNCLARLNPDDTLDVDFDPDVNGMIYIIVVQPDGMILIGGDFTTVNGQPRNYIARLNADGTLDMSFDPNANGTVMTIAVQMDSKILVGGFFNGVNSIGGETRNCIARLDPIFGLADSLDSNANSGVYTIVVREDGRILVGGGFASIGGQTRNRIAQLDAIIGLADSFNPNANATIDKIVEQADGKLLVCGDFATIGSQARSRIARIVGPLPGIIFADLSPTLWDDDVLLTADSPVKFSTQHAVLTFVNSVQSSLYAFFLQLGGGTMTGQLKTAAGTLFSNSAGIRLTSGTLQGAPQAGAVEFLMDGLYFTITTGAARRSIPLGPSAGPITFTGPTAPRSYAMPNFDTPIGAFAVMSDEVKARLNLAILQ